MENNFFSKQTRSSKIKALIVSEYFPKYCKIISSKGQEQIRYLDLFAGPGIYDDGSLSTPILVGQACASDTDLKRVVKLMFNDNKYCDKLKENFAKYFPEGTFTHKPVFGNKTVGEDQRIKDYLNKKLINSEGKNPYPTLLFVDPFGYKGVDTLVLAEFMKNWGNEIFLFLNIKRVHAAVENNKFDELMLDLFPTTINKIRADRKYKLKVEDRLSLIIENLAEEYQSILPGTLFSSAFKFQEEDSTATSHYILHFTKHQRGFDLVKQIYHDFDNIGAVLEKDGTYTFDAKRMDEEKTSMLDFGDQNIDILASLLKKEYAGRKVSAFSLFDTHQLSSKFSRRHYVLALRKLAAQGELTPTFTDKINHQVSVLLSDFCILQFN
jgi:three-Cys-motif partner protein